VRACERVSKVFRAIGSHSSVEKRLSAMALSHATSTVPLEIYACNFFLSLDSRS
jgi:hypothetical protein